MHEPNTGDDKRRPYKVPVPNYPPEARHGNVGDGLVPSRFEIMHEPNTGDDKRRPYKVPSRSVAPTRSRPELPPEARHGNVGDGLVPSRLAFVHGPGAGDRNGRPYSTRRVTARVEWPKVGSTELENWNDIHRDLLALVEA